MYNVHHITAYNTVVKCCFITLLLILQPFAAIDIYIYILIYIYIYIYMCVCVCVSFCRISHDVMGFMLYGIQGYAVINVANLTLRVTHSAIGAGKQIDCM